MQSQSTRKMTNSQSFRKVQGPSGKTYLVDDKGRLIDPETGMLYDPIGNLLVDPTTGLSVDLTTGIIYDMDGNPVSRVPLQELYGFRPVTAATPRTTSFSMPAEESFGEYYPTQGQFVTYQSQTEPMTQRVVKVLKKAGSVAKKTAKWTIQQIDNMAAAVKPAPIPVTYNPLYRRLNQALSEVEGQEEFFKTILRRMIEYVEVTNTRYITRKALGVMFPEADKKTLEKIEAAIIYLIKAGILPSSRS